MYAFFKKPTPKIRQFPFKVDIHAHLIPGIDDGPADVAESIKMIKKMSELGYQKLTATPHVFAEFYPNTKAKILDGFNLLKKEVTAAGIPVELSVAAEYFLDNTFEVLLDSEKLLTINDNQLLIEISTFGKPLNLYDLIAQIQQKGYQPVLAHPERYLHLSDKDYQKLLEAGCLFQLNMLSANGYYGRPVQKRAFHLIKNDWTHFIGTDVHSLNQVELIESLVGTTFFDQLLRKRPYARQNIAQFLGLF